MLSDIDIFTSDDHDPNSATASVEVALGSSSSSSSSPPSEAVNRACDEQLEHGSSSSKDEEGKGFCYITPGGDDDTTTRKPIEQIQEPFKIPVFPQLNNNNNQPKVNVDLPKLNVCYGRIHVCCAGDAVPDMLRGGFSIVYLCVRYSIGLITCSLYPHYCCDAAAGSEQELFGTGCNLLEDS